ncbi:unnamed protein product [Cercopithifilaria johnstoni]|uniref:G-protein coupled receptors family 1 profile domain-containing protein n=1 Tax=Cercopithifilaria johnstoni TaxID=2874296 RepID=A0A8J2LU49_9BILA|nr:unnamed protein product [Cercopithifilaria johnstoni]
MFIRYCYITVVLLILPVICQERNTTYEVDIRDENHMIAKYIAVILSIIFLLYGIISNTLMTIVLFCRGKENRYSHGFVLIAIQLIICNFMAFLPQMYLVLPEILQTESNSHENTKAWISIAFSTCKSFSLFVILHFSLLLAVNRFVALILPKYNAIFESTRLYFITAFMWLILLALQTADSYYCTRKFHVWNLCWARNCVKSNGVQLWLRIRDIWKLTIPNAMFVIYVAIFYSIHLQRRRISATESETNGMDISHYEWSMLTQAVWYCGTMEIGIIINKYLPRIWNRYFEKNNNIPMRIFLNCYIIFICALLPTIHFIYSEDSRDIIKHYLYHFLKLKIGRIKNMVTNQSFRT